MRMRLGILHDPEAQQRMHEREQRLAEEKKRKAEAPTVRSELEQKTWEEQQAKEGAEGAEAKAKEEQKQHRPKIKPLSEARAIELGANFFSEAFIFGVAVGLLVWDNWRSRAKESARRDDVADRLEALEADVEALRKELDPDLEALHDLGERVRELRKKKQTSWWNPGGWIGSRGAEDTAIMEEERDIEELQKKVEEKIVPIHKHIEDAKKTARVATTDHVTKDVKEAVDKKLEEKKKAKGLQSSAEEVETEAPERIDSVAATRKER